MSFTLENFDRADDKARTEIQKERLTRMLAALSATNEAIIRATSRAELFALVCEAAAKGGKFTLTSIAMIKPDSDFLDVVAADGPTASSAREAVHIDQRGAPGGARALWFGDTFAAGLHHQRLPQLIRAPRRFTVQRALTARTPALHSPCWCKGRSSA